MNLLDYAENSVIDFIKLKSNKKNLSQDATTCLKVYLNGIFLYCIQWTLKEMPITVNREFLDYVLTKSTKRVIFLL